jgi:hypothetical protein
MKLSIINYQLLIVLLIVLGSCKYFHNGKTDIVARAFDETLTISDIAGIVPPGTPKKDSINIVKNYLDSWVRQKVLLHKAEKNLSEKQKDFTHRIEDYRNSLIIYTFENELIKQKLDTNVSENEIESYYNNNPGNFELKDNIIKVIYVKTHIKDPVNKKIKKLYKSDRTEDKDELVVLCSKYAVNSFLEEDKWLFFNDLIKEIPIQTYDEEKYLKNHRLIEFQDSLYSYFINIKGFRIKEGIAPLSLERENIKNIILNKRKIELTKDMEDKAYKEALKNNEIMIK